MRRTLAIAAAAAVALAAAPAADAAPKPHRHLLRADARALVAHTYNQDARARLLAWWNVDLLSTTATVERQKDATRLGRHALVFDVELNGTYEDGTIFRNVEALVRESRDGHSMSVALLGA